MSADVCQSYLWGIFSSDGDRCTEIATEERHGKKLCQACAAVVDLMVED